MMLAQGIFLAAVNKKLIDYLFAPLKQRFPNRNWWWIQYVALVTGALISWFAGADLFGAIIAEPILSRVLSALFVGGGSSLIHDLFDKPQVNTQVVIVDTEGDLNAQ